MSLITVSYDSESLSSNSETVMETKKVKEKNDVVCVISQWGRASIMPPQSSGSVYIICTIIYIHFNQLTFLSER